jgi:hypothetical protein
MAKSGEFRVALLAAEGKCPGWMWWPLQAAADQSLVTLAAVVNIAGLSWNTRPWIVEAYAKWERNRYLPADNPLEDVDVDTRKFERVISLALPELNQLPSLLQACRANILLLVPPAEQVDLDGLDTPVWRFQFGCTRRTNREPGLWEVIERSPSSVSLVETNGLSRTPRTLETVVARTDPRSWVRNQLGLMAKASDLVRRWVPPQAIRIHRAELDSKAALAASKTDQQSSLAVLRLLARFVNHARDSALNLEQWQLAVDTTGKFGCLQDPEVLKPPLDRFWCDPFLFLRDGVLYIFVEECLYNSGKGHISVLSRSPSGVWSGPTIALERPYHLSYPFIFESQGELLLLPETTAAGRIELYHCVRFPDQWKLDTVLIDNLPGADSTLWFQDSRWWLFVDVKDELFLFFADSPRGPWRPHPGNPVKSDSRNSRPAGRIFRQNEDVIRPAQDCSLQYGRAVVFNKITRLTVDEFEEVEICRLRTPWDGKVCCHTFNQLEGTTVVDRLVQRRRLSRS